MSATYEAVGTVIGTSPILVSEETPRSGRGNARYRVQVRGVTVILSPDELFNLAESLDEMCDRVEDRAEA